MIIGKRPTNVEIAREERKKETKVLSEILKFPIKLRQYFYFIFVGISFFLQLFMTW